MEYIKGDPAQEWAVPRRPMKKIRISQMNQKNWSRILVRGDAFG
jgi:hypothetical protein